MGQIASAPTILVVFGATGDLMARKIVPSIFHLWRHGLLPDRFRVVGFSRRDFTDEDFRDHVRAILAEKYPASIPEEGFLDLFTYQLGTFEDPEAYLSLGKTNEAVAASWSACANRLFYLAVPPEDYGMILGSR